MTIFLKQSTASQSRAIGPFLDDTDFKTAETGLTIANTDIKLVVNGGASANKNSGGGTHRVNGVYGITFDATDTATVGEMEVSIVVAGALPVFHKFFVVEEAVYDMLFAASALGYIANAPVNVAQFGGSNGAFASGRPEVNTSHLAGSAVDQSGGLINANVKQISADATAADNLEAALDGTGGVTITAALTGNVTGNLSGSVGSVTGAVGSVTGAVGSVTGAVGSVTGNVGGNVAGSVASVTAGVTLANGAITAAKFAASAIDAAALASDAVTEIQSGLSTLTAANVNAEVVDALNTDTYAEPGQGSPGATISLAAKIGYIYKAWRNRTTQTASEYALYADDGVTKDQEAAVSDDGTTFIKAEVQTGA